MEAQNIGAAISVVTAAVATAIIKRQRQRLKVQWSNLYAREWKRLMESWEKIIPEEFTD